MTQTIGMVIENRRGHKERNFFGHRIFSETTDTICIIRHNTGMFPFLNYKWLGKIQVPHTNSFNLGDILAVTTDDVGIKKIVAIVKVGKESSLRYVLHDAHFIGVLLMAVVLLILKITNII